MNAVVTPKPIARDYLNRLSAVMQNVDADALDRGVALVNEAWHKGRQIITMGNGGSALTALHYINDWNKSVFMSNGRPFRGRSLCDNIGLLMSYANDVSYQDAFAEQLKNILQPGDLVIAISGSGNSENIIRAVNYANQNGGVTLGLCGYRGGKLKSLAQSVIWADIDDMQLSEDVHFIFGHMVMQSLAGMC
ncbi:MAG: SIS domain-containing protein [Alphaproteobacteria bacterium]|nr:SIS domain-containing protein [Alphaproteobacteria bacterium]